MKIYKKISSYAINHKYLVYISILCSLISVIFTMAGFCYIYEILKAILLKNDLVLAKSISIKTVIILTMGAIFYLLAQIFSHKLGFRIETNLRKKGVEGILNASFQFFDTNQSGKVRRIIDDNASNTHSAIAHLIPDLGQVFLMPIMCIVFSFVIDIKLAIALILVLILCGILASWMFTSESKFMDIYQDALKTMSAQTVEYIRGIQIIKIFKTNVESFKKLHNSIKDYSKYAYKYSKLCKLPFVLFQWIFYGSVAILMIPIVLNLKRLDPYNELILNIIMFLFLSGLILVSIMGIMYAGMYMYEANYAVDNLEKIYKEMDENKIRFGNEEEFKNYDIKFEHVDFSYGSKKVFEDFSVEFKQNKIYALVGESGCGKSTLVKLLSGFYNLDDGRILIGEKPIEKYSTNALSKNIAFVFQDSKLFNVSIYDNLKVAKEDATDKEIKRAIKLSYCDEFINNLPNGINTIIGEKGVYLSGGEKQRIAIARAILKNSPIIILDEASSAIDSDNEYKIQRAFSELMKNKTVIMIAHRLSSIKNVDEIIVLKDSKIIQRGNHKDLIKENSQYKKQFEMYEKANEWRL